MFGCRCISTRRRTSPRNGKATTARTSGGVVSGITDLSYYVDDVPLVSSSDFPEMDAGTGAGIPGTFTFAPKSAGVVGYVYSFNYGDQQTVTAGPDGTATVQWTPVNVGPW